MTMADDFLARGQCAPYRGPEGTHLPTAHQFVTNRLRALQSRNILEIQGLAERYVFEHDPTRPIRELVKSGQIENSLILETIRLVCSPMWIEMPVTYDSGRTGKVGIMMENRSGRTVYAIICDGKTMREPWTCGHFSTLELPSARYGTSLEVHSWCTPVMKATEANAHEINLYFRDAMDALFALSTPRVCETSLVSYSPRLQRARERRGKAPFLEYRRVRMVLGVGQTRYQRSGSDARNQTDDVAHRKLHRVVDHVRVYREGRETPKITFVPEHWRGDPELGVVLHERHVVKR